MSDIDRTRMIPLHIADQAVAACDAEIAKLREENQRLNAVIESHKDAGLRILAMLDEERRLTKHLKAEVERLTKAGDAMAELMFIDKDYIGSPKQEAVVEWCKATEAKETKPHA